jgi:hypothetical protein
MAGRVRTCLNETTIETGVR